MNDELTKEANKLDGVYFLRKVKLCPFCQCLPDWEGGDDVGFRVLCSNFNCAINPDTSRLKTLLAAVSSWNDRGGRPYNDDNFEMPEEKHWLICKFLT